MTRFQRRPRSTARIVTRYAVVTVVPVILLGVTLAASYRHEARQRGIAEGISEARLVAQSAIASHLDGRPLSAGLSSTEVQSLRALVKDEVADHQILRLRLRDLSGNVVFSDDGSGFKERPEDEAVEAARGTTVARLTRLNSDIVDSGPSGQEAVEVYLTLKAGSPRHAVGVMEVYLPYAPINADVTSGLHMLYLDLAGGLAALYLAMFIVSASVSRKLRQQLLLNEHLAKHDPLTDLPNRAAFHRHAETAVRATRRGESTAIAIIDLDRVKEVNDTLGHHSGDDLLRQIAARLGSSIAPGDAVARLGGDEFGIVLSRTADPEGRLWHIRNLIEQEVSVAGLPLSVDSSVGYVLAPEDGVDVDELLQFADVAMYSAKFQHAGVLRYEPSQNQYDTASLTLVGELRQAIESNQLVLHYQPKSTLAKGSIDGLEALVRWQHPVHGLIAPDRFIPLAEQTDLIDKLTDWVLNQSLLDLATVDLDENATVAVNVSARNLGRSGFAQRLEEALGRTGVPAHRLVIEITETALLVDPTRAAEVLSEISLLGVHISLDDFGRGQTSLGYLSTLPIDELKIDQSFVTDMLVNRAHAAIVRSIVDLGHNLSLRVVGEGVESEDVLSSLRNSGCDYAQGYVLARPMPIDELNRWLGRARLATAVKVDTI